jgi:hypothetical protein
MTKYEMLLNILDKIREEAAGSKYAPTYLHPATDAEGINQARARAFVHLYLKVSFGILEFARREHFVTDGALDGGIDGYYINRDTRIIYLIQSKFRTTEKNFSDKAITLQEILSMDIDRILDGREEDERGNRYNGKILQLQREIRETENIGRYTYKVILLANVEVSESQLAKLFGSYGCEVFDHEKSYDLLVFPVVSGTFFNATDLVIHLDLSNKNAGSKISYTVETHYGECDITALFVPTLEIARTFHRYKNSILKFNPRSYLELEGAKVNAAIRSTILIEGKNEFALYNNGLTMLSDDTNLNERIGQRSKAQLNIRNPQIINGGQTAYTLSRIFEETPEDEREALFAGKELLLKVITLNLGPESDQKAKLDLIDSISVATNQQTVVIIADRYSNEAFNVELQKCLFQRYGLLYERKRGEFQDGVYLGYIDRRQILERNLFFRLYFAANGHIKRATEKKIFARAMAANEQQPSNEKLDRFYFAFLCFKLLGSDDQLALRQDKKLCSQLYALVIWYKPTQIADFSNAAKEATAHLSADWDGFIKTAEKAARKFIRTRIDKRTNETVERFDAYGWFKSTDFLAAVTDNPHR